MIVDVHTHCFPPEIAKRALTYLTNRTGGVVKPIGDGTISCLVYQSYKNGIDKAVLCSVATRPKHFSSIFEFGMSIRNGECGEETRRRIVPLGSVHPDDGMRFEHLRLLAEAGFPGIKLHPYYQNCVLDSPEMLEYFHCCRDLDLVVQCHCGYDVGFPREDICGPDRVAHVLREVPGLKFIAAHLGGWNRWDEAVQHLLGKDVFLDTSMLRHLFDDPNAHRLLREHPAEKLLMATDWPWLSFADGISYVKNAGLPEASLPLILGENAKKLLHLEE